MLALFTELLRDFLVRRGVVPRDRVFLGPPDRAFVAALPSPGVSLNVYLADIRENRRLRTNERFRVTTPSGNVREDPYPAWVDAHYLITAWDTSKDLGLAAIAEQETLAAVSAALLAGDPFTPNTVYADPTDEEVAAFVALLTSPVVAALIGAPAAFGGAAGARATLTRTARDHLGRWPEEFRQPGLPYEVLPPDGFPKLSEFWTTMGQGSAWKPVVYLVASVPVQLPAGPEFPIVTGVHTATGQTGDASANRLADGTAHPWHQIGGTVYRLILVLLDPLVPVPGVRLVLQLPADPPRPAIPLQEERTDEHGRFRLVFAGVGRARRPDPNDPASAADLRADPLAGFHTEYELVVRSPEFPDTPHPVTVDPQHPLPYDLILR